MTNLAIATNATNDIYIGPDGKLVMGTGVFAVQQSCEHAMKAQFGEMFLQPTAGLPTLGDVWASKNFIKYTAIARATLSAVPGVVSVQNFTISAVGDTANYTAQILTVYSSTLLTILGTLT